MVNKESILCLCCYQNRVNECFSKENQECFTSKLWGFFVNQNGSALINHNYSGGGQNTLTEALFLPANSAYAKNTKRDFIFLQVQSQFFTMKFD